MPIVATGTVPATILENGRAGDWSAILALSGATGITDVALTGAAGNLFQAELGPSGRVTLNPWGALDREAYAVGADPVLTFGLTAKVGGTWQAVTGSWSVTLRGLDDTAPSSLRFSTGGTVLENDVGASIGSLVADDPDSPAGNLEYRVLWPDEALFEIVGTTLKLREGVDLLRLGGTTREVMIGVSDGLNEAAFSLGVQVANVTDQDGNAPSPPASPPSSPPASPPSSPPASPPPPPPAADIVVTHTGSATAVAEDGATDVFTVSLSYQPTATVTVTLTVGADLNLSRSATGTFGKTVSFAIAPADWNRPRNVVVAAVNDAIHEGPESPRIAIAVASADPAFAALTNRGFAVDVTDNDLPASPPPPVPPPPPGLVIQQTGGATAVAERGAGDSFTVALNARPLSAVTVTLSAGPDLLLAPSGGTPAGSITVTFTEANWAAPRAIMVSAVNDLQLEGTTMESIAFSLSSVDPGFNRLPVAGLPVLVQDAPPPASPPVSPPPSSGPVRLAPGGSSSLGVMSDEGEAVLARTSAEVVSISAAQGGLLVTLRDGTSTLLTGATDIAFSDGHLVFDGASAGARALRAYQTFLGIDPPAGAVAHTASLLEQGVPMEAVTASLLDMREWAIRTAALTPTQKIQLIYQDVIGYAPPKPALDWLTYAAGTGATLAQISAMLIDTPEAVLFSEQQNPNGIWVQESTRANVVRAYDAVLDQTPDAAALARWSLLIDGGAITVHQLYQHLSATELFQARHGAQSNAEFVASAYQQALERPASSAELAWTTSLLNQGRAGRVDILHSLGDMQQALAAPGSLTEGQQTVFEERQAEGDVLRRGQSLADLANSKAGLAVSTHSAADLSRIDVALDGLVLRWRDGTVERLGGVDELSFADGRLVLDGGSGEALVTRLYESTIGVRLGSASVAEFNAYLERGITPEVLTQMFLNTGEAAARFAGLDQGGQIRLVYTGLLGYAPSPDALGYMKAVMQQGLSLAGITTWLAQLPETVAAFERTHPMGIWIPDPTGAAVVRAFDAMLDTTPDPASLLIWKNALNSPGAIEALYQTLMSTELHAARYDGVSEADWVTGHYQAALERDPGVGEVRYSAGLLESGAVSHLAMAYAIAELQPLPEPARFASNLSLDLL